MGEAFDDSRLANTRLAHQHGVVLGAAHQNLHEAQDLLFAADHGVEFSFCGKRGQVHAVLVQGLERAFGGRAIDAASAAHFLERLGQRSAAQAGAFGSLRQLVAGIGQQCEQQVLGAGELIAAALGISQGQVERLLGARRDIHGATLGRDGAATELGPQPFEQQRGLEAIQLLEGGLDKTVRLTEQGEQQVLGVELVVAKAKQQLLDSRQRFACFVGESFERDQGMSSRLPRRTRLRQP